MEYYVCEICAILIRNFPGGPENKQILPIYCIYFVQAASQKTGKKQ